MEILETNGWVYEGKGCKCEGSPPIYKKGEYTISIIRSKTFKVRGVKNRLITHRRLDELGY